MALLEGKGCVQNLHLHESLTQASGLLLLKARTTDKQSQIAIQVPHCSLNHSAQRKWHPLDTYAMVPAVFSPGKRRKPCSANIHGHNG